MNPFSLYHSTMEETRHITHQRKGLIRVTDFIKVQDCTCWSHYKQWNHTLTSFSSQASFSYSKKNIGIAQESLLKLKLSDSAPQFPCCHNGANTICPWLGTCWESSCKRAHLCGQSEDSSMPNQVQFAWQRIRPRRLEGWWENLQT